MKNATILIVLLVSQNLFANLKLLHDAHLTPFSTQVSVAKIPHTADECTTFVYDTSAQAWEVHSTEKRSRIGDSLFYSSETEQTVFILNPNDLVVEILEQKRGSEDTVWHNKYASSSIYLTYNDAQQCTAYHNSTSRPGPYNKKVSDRTFSYNKKGQLIGLSYSYDYQAPRVARQNSHTMDISVLQESKRGNATDTLHWNGTSFNYSQMHGSSSSTTENVALVFYNDDAKIERVEQRCKRVNDDSLEDTSLTSYTYSYTYDDEKLIREERLMEFENPDQDAMLDFYEYTYEGELLMEVKSNDTVVNYTYNQQQQLVSEETKTGVNYEKSVHKKEYCYYPTAVTSPKEKTYHQFVRSLTIHKNQLSFSVQSTDQTIIQSEIVTLQGRSVHKESLKAAGKTEVTLPENLSSGVYLLLLQGGLKSAAIPFYLP